MNTTTDLIERYVALWNDPDPEARHRAVQDLWTDNGCQVLTPPKEVVDTARAIGFPSPTFEVRGHDELNFRVDRAHEEFVAPGQFVFRARPGGQRVRDVVLFGWDMVTTADEEKVGGGSEVLVLDAAGRIVTDYQFVDP
jgi:hypothetical protein